MPDSLPRLPWFWRLASGRVPCWLAGLLLLCLSAWAPAWAQNPVGSVHQGMLDLGRGSQLVLPEGRWRVVATKSLPRISQWAFDWDALILENLDVHHDVPLLVVRHVPLPSRATASACVTQNEQNAFITDDYGTTPSQILSKCSRAHALGNLGTWRSNAAKNSEWWREVAASLPSNPAYDDASLILTFMAVQRFNGRALRVEAFVRPPAGRTATQFRDLVRSGQGGQPQAQFEAWIAGYVSQMEAAFLDQRGTASLKLAQPFGGSAGQPGTQVAAATAAPRPTADAEQAQRQLAQQLEEARKTLAQLQREREVASTQVPAAALPAPPPATVLAGAAPVASAPATPHKDLPPPAGGRKALVIGNDSYSAVAPLLNARADAQAMSAALQKVGFAVSTHMNLNEKGFKQALRDFRQRLQNGDEVVFFYAGHGVQIGNTNFLLPVDIRGDNEDQVRDDAIQLQRVLDDMQERKVRFALAVVDACRDNPFRTHTRAIGTRGLAPTQAATGQMIIFSAGSGQQALDRLGTSDPEKNGLFTRVMLREMLKPGLPVDRVLRNVRNEVVRLARSVGHEQTPALYDQAIGDFYFQP
jgi:hypothetical protein